MANRNYNRRQALEKEVKDLYVDIAIGASGAPTVSRGQGIASVSRTSTGLYVITLQDAYMNLMSCDVQTLTAAAEDIQAQLVSESVASAKTISFRTVKSSDATVVDPSSGARLLVQIQVKNSSI